MRAIQVKEYLSGPKDMTVVDVPDPISGPDRTRFSGRPLRQRLNERYLQSI